MKLGDLGIKPLDLGMKLLDLERVLLGLGVKSLDLWAILEVELGLNGTGFSWVRSKIISLNLFLVLKS